MSNKTLAKAIKSNGHTRGMFAPETEVKVDRRFDITLTGTMPLLMHWDNPESELSEDRLAYAAAHRGDHAKGDDRSPAWTWFYYVSFDAHPNGKNEVGIPWEYIVRILGDAGAQMKGAKANSTLKREAVASVMPIVDEHLCYPLRLGSKKRTLTYEQLKPMVGVKEFRSHVEFARKNDFNLLVKRAAVGQSRHVRVRPQFPVWQVTIPVTLLASTQLSGDSFGQLWKHAERLGIGDWRPSAPKSPGIYGTFKAEIQEV